MELLVVWTVLSLLIGMIARARGDVFLHAFLAAFFLSPLVGFAITMLKLPVNHQHAKARETHPA